MKKLALSTSTLLLLGLLGGVADEVPIAGRTSPPPDATLILEWSGVVDAVDDLHIKGESVQIVHRHGGKASDTREQVVAALPKKAGFIYAVKVEGRGQVAVLQDPAEGNDYEAVVSVRDGGAGSRRLTVRVYSSEKAPAEPTAPTGAVSVLDRLDRVTNTAREKTPEGFRITGKSVVGLAKLETLDQFKVPLTITAVAKTDSLNIRVFYGKKGETILNWEVNPAELRTLDPKTGAERGAAGKGFVPTNTWVTIDWTIAEDHMRIDVNGVERARFRGDYAGISGTVGIGTCQKAVVNVKSLIVTPLRPSDGPKVVDTRQPVSTVPVDVVVPSGSAAKAGSAISQPVGDPNAIERPDYRNKAKALVKSLTSVTAMMVQMAEDGQATGITGDIIATVSPESRSSGKSGAGFVRSDGDQTMKTVFQESMRAVILRYPKWEPGHIDISFGEKFVKHGGPSAGTAFAMLTLSCLEGFDIDPRCAVTGDITVDWRVREVGGVTAKIRGATLDKCLYALIPEGNEAAFVDMPLLYGRSALWGIQVFSIATLQQAIAIARTDRTAPLAEAIKLFAGLQVELDKAEQSMLRSPGTKETLKHILELAPNHLSAKHLLAACEQKAPKTLSVNGTLAQVFVLYHAHEKLLHSGKKIDRITLPSYVTIEARKRLNVLRPIAHAEVRPLVADIAAFIEAMDGWAERPSSSTAETMMAKAEKLDARFAALYHDPGFMEKLSREGY